MALLSVISSTTASAQLTKTEISNAINGENGYNYHGLASVTESYVSSDANNNNGGEGYRFVGVMDGLGAFELDEDTVRVLMNHEVGSFPKIATPYTTGDGLLTLGGGRVSYVDIDKATMRIIDSGIAINSFVDGFGNPITSTAQFDNGSSYGPRTPEGYAPLSSPADGGLDRPCSGQFFPVNSFGDSNAKPGKVEGNKKEGAYGFEDPIYMFGEEEASGFGGFGGQFWALDVHTGICYECPDLGRGAWESGTLINTGSPNTIAFLMGDDYGFSSSDPTGSPGPSAYLYVGTKNPDGDFLERNGLKGGTIYAWVPKHNFVDGPRELINVEGTGTVLKGGWVPLDNTGSLTVDGTATDAELRTRAKDKGAQIFSRPEDVHTDPNNGKIAVMANTGRVFDEDGDGVPDLADPQGSLHVFDFTKAFKGNGQLKTNPTSTTVINVFDCDEDIASTPSSDFIGVDSPDNLVWSADGFIYVQEDGDEDAGIYKIDPDAGTSLRIARADVDFPEFDEDSSTPESSGIIDVSELFGYQPGELFMLDTQNHNVDVKGELDINVLGYDPGEFAQLGYLAAPGVELPEAFFEEDED